METQSKLTQLPSEIWIYILTVYLYHVDIRTFSRVCKRYHQLGTDDLVWKNKCIQYGVPCEKYAFLAKSVAKQLRDKEEELYGMYGLVRCILNTSRERYTNAKGKVNWSGVLNGYISQRSRWLHGSCRSESIQAHEKGLTAILVSEDGRYLVTAGWDKSIRVWRLWIDVPEDRQEDEDLPAMVGYASSDEDEEFCLDQGCRKQVRVNHHSTYVNYDRGHKSTAGRFFRMETGQEAIFQSSCFQPAEELDNIMFKGHKMEQSSNLLELIHHFETDIPITPQNIYWIALNQIAVLSPLDLSVSILDTTTGRFTQKVVIDASSVPIVPLTCTSLYQEMNTELTMNTSAQYKAYLAIANGSVVWLFDMTKHSSAPSHPFRQRIPCQFAFCTHTGVENMVFLNERLLIIISPEGCLLVVDISSLSQARLVSSTQLGTRIYSKHHIQIDSHTWELSFGLKDGRVLQWVLVVDDVVHPTHVHMIPRPTLQGSDEWITSIYKFPQSHITIGSDWSGRAYVWDTSSSSQEQHQSPRVERILRGGNSAILTLCAVQNKLLVGTYDGRLTIWDFK